MKVVYFFLLSILLFCAALGKEESFSGIGLFGNYNINQYKAQFPDKYPCCPGLKDGNGTGFSFGALFEQPLGSMFSVQLRAGYYMLDGKFKQTSSTQKVWDIKGDLIENGVFEKNLDAKISLIGFEPLFSFQPFGGLKISIGALGGYMMTKKFDYYETILNPPGYVFYDDKGNEIGARRSLTDLQANANSFQVFGVGSLSYEIFLSSSRSISITPELFYRMGLTSIIKETPWKVNQFSGGLAFKYMFGSSCKQGYEKNKQGNCVPKCGNLMVRNVDGDCQCISGLILVDNNCECSGRRIYNLFKKECECPPEMTWSGKTAQCECDNGKVWNPATKKCECPQPMAWNPNTNKCECFGGRVWIADKKTCDCIGGKIWFEEKQQCDCPSQFVWNENTKKCECPGGKVWDDIIRMCKCPKNQEWDSLKNRCACTGGMVWNDSLRTCLCPEGVWSEKLGRCIPATKADVTAYYQISGSDSSITISEEVKEVYLPLLPFIFFSEGSSEIPARYSLYESQIVTSSYSEKSKISPSNNLSAYYEILNILGRRLKANSNLKVTLSGFEPFGNEAGYRELTSVRINKIKDYLINVWNVSGSQLSRRIDKPPADLYNSSDKLVMDMFRRIQIESDEYSQSINDPYIYRDTLQVSDIPAIQFNLISSKVLGIESWNFNIIQGGNYILDSTGKGRHPGTIGFMPGYAGQSLSSISNKLEYRFIVKYEDGRVQESKIKTIPLKWLTEKDKADRGLSDTITRDYRILLPFGVTVLKINTELRRALDMIKIDPDKSVVNVIGSTNYYHEVPMNSGLGMDHANTIIRYLGTTTGLNVNRGAGRIDKEGLGLSGTRGRKLLPEEVYYENKAVIIVKTPTR